MSGSQNPPGSSSQDLTSSSSSSSVNRKQSYIYKTKSFAPSYRDVLTPQQIDVFTEAFNTFADSSSKSIKNKSFGYVLQSLGMSITKKEMDEGILQIDVTKSGTIHLEEFLDWMGAKMKEADKLNEEFEAFKFMDLNDNDVIDAFDVQCALKFFSVQARTEEAKAMIKSFDSNGSGQISWKEFKKIIEKIKDHHK